jgi:hypothetical protein
VGSSGFAGNDTPFLSLRGTPVPKQSGWANEIAAPPPVGRNDNQGPAMTKKVWTLD